MTTTTATGLAFPRLVVDLEGSGWPFYPYLTGIPGEDVQWRSIPTLPAGGNGLRWATEHDPIGHPYTVLDLDVVTELLYTSALVPTDRLSRSRLADVVDGRLYAYACRVAPCAEHDERHRLADCRAWATLLIGGAV